MKILTLTEYVNADQKRMWAFNDTEAGKKEAIDLFVKISKENGASDKYMERDIKDGYYGSKDEDYQLFIDRSINEIEIIKE